MDETRKFLNFPVVQSLLQCDTRVYGNVVRELCRPYCDITTYLRSSAIVAYVSRGLQNVVERSIHQFATKREAFAVTPDYSIYRYRVNLDSTTQTTMYVTFTSEFRTTFSGIGSVLDFDVSSLELDRTGIRFRTIPPTLQTHPCPLQFVLDACGNEEFTIVREPDDGDGENFILARIARLCRIGWRHAGCLLTPMAAVPADFKCSICIDHDNAQACLAIGPCGHTFHEKCLAEHCQKTTRRQPIFPRIVSCPLCRHKIKSHELAPLVLLDPV